MIAYFDASALVKRYVNETHSDLVARLLTANRLATSRLSDVELVSAFERRCREGSISATDRDRVVSAQRKDMERAYIVELGAEVCTLAHKLLRRYPLRAGDAVQLASCLRLVELLRTKVPFVAFDERLVSAARKEGLEVPE